MAFSQYCWVVFLDFQILSKVSFSSSCLSRKSSPEQNAHVTYPRLSNGSGGAGASNNNKNSTWWLRNGSFLRLKNIEIGYTLPKEFVTKTFIKSLRFYVSGNNLLTFSSFKLWDPEKAKGSSDGSGYPLNCQVLSSSLSSIIPNGRKLLKQPRN
jgi:hypothetical protein